MRVQEGKGLDIKPPDLGVGGGLALVVHRKRASHAVQRVGTSVQGVKKKKHCQLLSKLCICCNLKGTVHPKIHIFHRIGMIHRMYCFRYSECPID